MNRDDVPTTTPAPRPARPRPVAVVDDGDIFIRHGIGLRKSQLDRARAIAVENGLSANSYTIPSGGLRTTSFTASGGGFASSTAKHAGQITIIAAGGGLASDTAKHIAAAAIAGYGGGLCALPPAQSQYARAPDGGHPIGPRNEDTQRPYNATGTRPAVISALRPDGINTARPGNASGRRP
jgi:hypothetical protein